MMRYCPFFHPSFDSSVIETLPHHLRQNVTSLSYITSSMSTYHGDERRMLSSCAIGASRRNLENGLTRLPRRSLLLPSLIFPSS
jgi:hypothetical protein